MLNCDSLNKMSSIFQKLCIIFKSKGKSKAFCDAYDKIISKIENRKLFKSEEFENDIFESKNLHKNNISTKSIKENSKFGKHFLDLESKTIVINNEEKCKNEYYAPQFITFLQDYFMPYCFLWSAFVLKGLNITRITNGSLENHIGHVKSKITTPLLPFEYTNFVYKSTQGKAIEFINSRKASNTFNDEEINNDAINGDDYDQLIDEVISIY